MANKVVGIIGAGLGGLSAAIRLACKGYDVTVFEANAAPGGKASSINESGFRFDTGPSLLTMVHVLEDLFRTAGEEISEYLDLRKPSIICKYFYEDGRVINAYSDVKLFSEEIEKKTNDKKNDVERYLNYSKRIYDLTADIFLNKSLSEVSTYINKSALKALLNIKRIDLLNSMNGSNKKYFKDSRNVQLFNRYGTYTGSNPYQAPATLNIIQYVEYVAGVYINTKGIYSIVEALYEIAKKKGVKFFFDTPVERIILTTGQKVSGIKTAKQSYFFDLVISNVDELLTERLLGKEITDRKDPSSSGLVFYWGIEGTYNNLEIHNILFSENYKDEFESIFKDKIIPEDPTIYIYISSKFNKEDAPKNCENWFVMINTPSMKNIDQKEIIRIRKLIIDKIKRVLKIDIKEKIINERIITPLDLEERTGALNGSIYGNSSNSRFAAFLRKQNRSKKYEGLFYTGGTVHPGGGIPLVLLSSKITTDLIEKYHDKRK